MRQNILFSLAFAVLFIGAGCTNGINAASLCDESLIGRDCSVCGVAGVNVCVGGAVRCIPDFAPVELCSDAVDNNCDGRVNEGCAPACTPSTEVCNEHDDDCDGRVDEGFDRDSDGFATCTTNPVLRDCDDTRASVNPGQPELCSDAVDNNCDGRVDEGCTPTCSPVAETCNGLDDDCDGAVDEHDICGVSCPGAGTSCSRGVGACQRFGTAFCPSGSSSATECTAVPGSPTAEVCDGIDNNCNGAVDEGTVCGECTSGTTRSCTTTCGSIGFQTCSSSRTWGSCVPPAETCNSRDDDCDGLSDEGGVCGTTCSGAGASCSRGTGACMRFGVTFCPTGSTVATECTAVAASPTTEVCNGVDDDCDGLTDEGSVCGVCTSGTTRSCTTTCGSIGFQTCSSSRTWGSCVPPAETCNSRDDDCDGLSDEGGVCGGTCTGAFVGREICVEYGPDMPPILTYGGDTVVHADIVIFDCGGTPRVFTITSSAPRACLTLPTSSSSTCQGWLATTYSEGPFSDENNIGSWYSSSTASYLGMRASNSALSGTLTSTSQIRVFARTPGLADRELTDRSWIVYDPTGARVSSYATHHSGERVIRLMVPVRVDCVEQFPPDRY